MNLVAKEFVTVQAAEELREALPCNPFDVAGLAGTIALALELDEDDRRCRIELMAATVPKHDVFWWLEQEFRTAAAVSAVATTGT
jgi:trehalose-6-phosphate synthase